MSEERYEAKEGKLLIHDPELGLEIEEAYSTACVPEKAEAGMEVAGGHLVKVLEVVPHMGRQKKGDPDTKEPSPCIDSIYLEKEGVRDGETCLFYPSGKLRASTFYLAGQLHGPSVYFTEEGGVFSKAFYVRGKIEGKVYHFYENGKAASIERFVAGKREGVQEYFFENGQVKSTIPYLHDKLEGQVMLYSDLGHPKREINFKSGEQKGIERLWDDFGKLAAETDFVNRFEIKESKQWHKNGQLAKHEYHHTPGKFDIRQWNIDGVLLREGVYDEDGVTFTHRLWDEKGNLKMEKKGRYQDGKLLFER